MGLLWCKHFNKICIFICLIWACLVKGWTYTSISSWQKLHVWAIYSFSFCFCLLTSFLCTQLQHVVSRCYSLLRMFRHISYTAIKRHGADVSIKQNLVVFSHRLYKKLCCFFFLLLSKWVELFKSLHLPLYRYVLLFLFV